MAFGAAQPPVIRWVHLAAVCCLTVGLISLYSPAVAQNNAAGQADEALRRLQERQEQILQEQRVPFKAPAVPEVSQPLDPSESDNAPDSACLNIQTLQLNAPARFQWLAQQTQNAVGFAPGTCLGKKGLASLVKKMGKHLLDAGYITSRVLVPEQDLSTGLLTLDLQVGTIAEYRFQFANPEQARWLSTSNLFAREMGDVLNLRQLEQAIEQMRRLSSEDAELDLQIGPVANSTLVVIKIPDRKPWRIWASMDDSGSKATGKINGSVGISIDSPLRLHDQLVVTYSSDLENDKQRGNQAYNVSYSIPYDAWLLSLGAGRSRYRQIIAGAVQDFSSSGRSDTQDIKLARTLWRDQSTKLSGYGRLVRRNSDSFIDDIEIPIQRQRNKLSEWGLGLRQLWGAWQIEANAAYRHTVDLREGPANNPAYSLSTADLNAVRPFYLQAGGKKLPARYTLALRGQQAHGAVGGSDFFSIGSRYTVRGFDGQRTLAAEGGWIWRNEVALTVQQGVELYGGLDTGAVKGPSTQNLAGTTLTGTVLGLRWNPAPYLSVEGFVGRPLAFPSNFVTTRCNFGFNLYFQF